MATSVSADDELAEGSSRSTDGAIYPIRAVERVCDILDILHEEEGGVALAAVAKRAALPKSSAYRYLLALESRHYVERDAAAGTFRLGLAFRPQRSRQLDFFIERAQPALQQLCDKLNETVNIGVLDGGQIVHVAVVECTHMMRLAARVGERAGVHATALGKVITAELPRERVVAILHAEGMAALTSRTITSVDGYLGELDKVRAQGFAVDDLEAQDDGRCVAVPLKGLPVAAGLSVSAPSNRLSNAAIPNVVTQLRRCASGLMKDYLSLPS
jgi:IclR family acetate operon transcriptional repressor